jgi:hypothetical protein
MQFVDQGKPPTGVVFDTGMTRIDEALALAVLYGLDGKNEARAVAISVSRSNLLAAMYCDAVARFYAGEVSGAFGSIGRTLPIGLAGDGRGAGDSPMVAAALARKNQDGTPLYKSNIQRTIDTAEAAGLIRNALSSQYDGNAIIVATGPLGDLARLLELGGARDWIEKKVKFLCLSAGTFPDGPPEPSVKADVSSAKKLFAEWPTPIFAAGSEVGQALPFPGDSIDKDFAWSPNHPVVDAYRAFQPMPYDAPGAALAAVLYAVRPQEPYFKLSEPGTIGVLDDGRVRFQPAAQGKHRYLVADPAQKDKVLRAYVELASAKPVPRQPRRFGQKKNDK